jgi:hypothetical protein
MSLVLTPSPAQVMLYACHIGAITTHAQMVDRAAAVAGMREGARAL